MNNGPMLFLGIFAALAASFWGLLLGPQLQIGRQQPVVLQDTGAFYPVARPGLAQQGADIYRSLGCAECHTRQVRQTGYRFDVWITEPATNPAPFMTALAGYIAPDIDASALLATIPARVVTGLPVERAHAAAKQVSVGGAKAEAVLVTLGGDISRGWGRRGSVAQDYLGDHPVQIGSLRIGPDLADFGGRQPALNEGAVRQAVLAEYTNSAVLHGLKTPPALADVELAALVRSAIDQTNALAIYRHLYNPQAVSPGSMMPPHRFLFEHRVLSQGDHVPSDAVVTTTTGANAAREIAVPRHEARALAAYLLSLRTDAGLFEAPVPKPPSAPAANVIAGVPAP